MKTVEATGPSQFERAERVQPDYSRTPAFRHASISWCLNGCPDGGRLGAHQREHQQARPQIPLHCLVAARRENGRTCQTAPLEPAAAAMIEWACAACAWVLLRVNKDSSCELD
jgi:hypothetical protein